MDKLIELQKDFVNERLGTFIHWNSAAAQFHDSKDIIDWEYGVENGGDTRQYPFNEADWNPRHLDCKKWAKIAQAVVSVFSPQSITKASVSGTANTPSTASETRPTRPTLWQNLLTLSVRRE